MVFLKHGFAIFLFLYLVSRNLGWQPGLVEAEGALQQQVEQFVNQGQHSPAVAAMLITPKGSQTAVAGQTGNPGQPIPTPDTLFEIGSITKVFTALLLAQQADEGEVALDEPIGDLLPENLEFPGDIANLPLQSLASHNAGFPRLPLSRILMGVLYPVNPYRGSQPAELYQALATASPSQPNCQYSNLGPALLGQLLARRAGESYKTLVQTRVLAPLGLNDTYFNLTPDAAKRLALGHQPNGLPTANWQMDAYAPAGGLKSTLADMGKFLTAAMAADWPPMALSLRSHPHVCPIDQPSFGLGWIFNSFDDMLAIMHNGSTGGYYAFLGWQPEAGRGLVLLTNTSDTRSEQVAIAMLRGQSLPPVNVVNIRVLTGSVFLGLLLVYRGWQLINSRLPTNTLNAGQEILETSLFLALGYQLGPWQWLPIGLWWGCSVLFVGLSANRLRQLPLLRLSSPLSRSEPWQCLRFGLTLLILSWVMGCLR